MQSDSQKYHKLNLSPFGNNSTRKREQTFGNESSARGSNTTANFRKSNGIEGLQPPRLSMNIQDAMNEEEDDRTKSIVMEEDGSIDSYKLSFRRHES